jgi:hypothetical protein
MRASFGALLLLSACNANVATSSEAKIEGDGAPIDRTLYGVSIDAPSPARLRFLSALGPGVIRWPATASRRDVDAFIDFTSTAAAEPVIAAPASDARALLRYVNVEKDYRVRWLEVEPSLFDALRAIDPRVRFVDAGWINEPVTEGTLDAALDVADSLGRSAERAPGAVLRAGLLDERDAPRPAYGAYWLFARHFGDRVAGVQGEGSVYAARRRDGDLSVVVVNRTASARRVQLRFDFEPHVAEAFTLTGPDPHGAEFAINGKPLTPVRALAGFAPEEADPTGVVELPAWSMRLSIYRH